MNLAQAVKASQEHCAYLVVSPLRILVQFRKQKLRVLVQYRSKRHWTLTSASGGVRYLNGVLREGDGTWVIDGYNCASLDLIAHSLPTAYQHLLVPDSDDWHIMMIEDSP